MSKFGVANCYLLWHVCSTLFKPLLDIAIPQCFKTFSELAHTGVFSIENKLIFESRSPAIETGIRITELHELTIQNNETKTDHELLF